MNEDVAMAWSAEALNGFWYCTRRGTGRTMTSFLCADRAHAERCAEVLNDCRLTEEVR